MGGKTEARGRGLLFKVLNRVYYTPIKAVDGVVEGHKDSFLYKLKDYPDCPRPYGV